MRRRNLSYKSEVTGQPVEVLRDELKAEKTLEDRMRELNALTRFRNIRLAASSNAVGLISGLLVSPRFLASRTLTEAALAQMESKLESASGLDSSTVLSIATPFADPNFGSGLARAESVNPALFNRDTVKSLLDSNVLSTIDKLGTSVQDSDRLLSITNEVIGVASGSDQQTKDGLLQVVNSATTLLNSRNALAQPAVGEVALASLENVTKLDAAQATNTVSTLENPTLGSGLARLAQVDLGIKDTQVVKDLAATGALADLDKIGSTVTDETQLKTITSEVLDLARSTDPAKTTKIGDLLNTHLKGISK
jgi:hypothetical protein